MYKKTLKQFRSSPCSDRHVEQEQLELELEQIELELEQLELE
jgi:hypothetical protein